VQRFGLMSKTLRRITVLSQWQQRAGALRR
jgi:hypothetical protein